MRYILTALFVLISYQMKAQINILNQAKENAGSLLKNDDNLNNFEIANGLKEALFQGSDKAISSASLQNGFSGNKLIRILWPKEAKKMKSVLIKSGMRRQVIEFENNINRAAEIASESAKEILIEAIRSINIKNAASILNGSDNAATEYLKEKCSAALCINFQPIVNKSIKEVGLMKYWDSLINSYNKIPFTKSININLEEYIVKETVNGIFVLMAIEEEKIRNNPKYRETELLKKIFN